MKGYLWYGICPCLAPTAEPISSKWENSRSQREAQKAAQRHFVGLSEVTSALGTIFIYDVRKISGILRRSLPLVTQPISATVTFWPPLPLCTNVICECPFQWCRLKPDPNLQGGRERGKEANSPSRAIEVY